MPRFLNSKNVRYFYRQQHGQLAVGLRLQAAIAALKCVAGRERLTGRSLPTLGRLHRRSQDFVCGVLFFLQKADDLF